jgi:UDP-glucose 4-epimerase
MKVLVTGGCGFVGSHLLERLASDHEIVAFDNLSVGKRANLPAGCELIEGDIADARKLAAAMKGVDVVFHDAAFVSIRASFSRVEEVMRSNFIGTLNVFSAARANGVGKVVIASSMDVYGEPQYLPVDEKHPLATKSPYGLSKIFGEKLCDRFGDEMTCIALRYFNIYGTRQTPSSYVGVTTTFINQALAGESLTVNGDGSQTRDYVSVDDVADANVLAMGHGRGGIFNIGSGDEYSVNDIADMVNKCVEKKVPIKYQKAPEGEIKRIRSDISLARKELGYAPKRKLSEEMPRLIDWWRENGRNKKD